MNVRYSLNKFGAISQYFKEQFSKTNYILCYKQQIETTELNMGACRTQADVVIYTMAKSACALLKCLLPFGISLQNGIHYH